MKTETCCLIKSSPWTAEKQAVNVPKPTLQLRGLKTLWRFESWLPMSVDATPIQWSSISRRIIVLISNMSDMNVPDSADLPKVMECRWSFIYLGKQTVFYQGKKLYI